MSETLRILKEEIKALAAQGRAMNPRIQAAAGRERHSLRVEKAEVGDRARHALLAYAMLRGIPRSALEQTCAREPSAELICALSHESHGRVAAWLKGEEEAGEVVEAPAHPATPATPARPRGLIARVFDAILR